MHRLLPFPSFPRTDKWRGSDFFESTALSVDQLAAQAEVALPLSPSDPPPVFYNETLPGLEQTNWAATVPSSGPFIGQPVNTQVHEPPRRAAAVVLCEAFPPRSKAAPRLR